MILGIIGGGQLAKMLVDETNRMRLETVVMTPYGSDPVCKSTKNVIYRSVDDCKGIKYLSERCDAITFENEFVDIDTLRREVIFNYRPSLEALAICIDKYAQRQFLDELSVPQPSYRMFNLRERVNFPCVIKTTRFGYDGKGTYIIKNYKELNDVSPKLVNVGLIKEEFIKFDKELAIMVARNAEGEVALFPLVESVQSNDNICDYVVAHNNFNSDVVHQAHMIAERIVHGLDYVGLMGIEMFLKDGQVLVNELAPRAHNSGHYTMDACHSSQFKIQVQSITGEPFGDTSMKCQAALMINLLGYEYSYKEYTEELKAIAEIPNTTVHWYGKMESRPMRKLGHVNILLTNEQLKYVHKYVHKVKQLWNPENK